MNLHFRGDCAFDAPTMYAVCVFTTCTLPNSDACFDSVALLETKP
jgi:hypothetical protein